MVQALTHFNQAGEAHMVDVGDKPVSKRRAIAGGEIVMQSATLERILAGDMKKGDVLAVARIAGIMAAKQTGCLIPLCHPLMLSKVSIAFEHGFVPQPHISCQTLVETTGQTGVEIEALQACQTALLTIYDMCKAIDKGMVMQRIRLIEKEGGRSGHYKEEVL